MKEEQGDYKSVLTFPSLLFLQECIDNLEATQKQYKQKACYN